MGYHKDYSFISNQMKNTNKNSKAPRIIILIQMTKHWWGVNKWSEDKQSAHWSSHLPSITTSAEMRTVRASNPKLWQRIKSIIGPGNHPARCAAVLSSTDLSVCAPACRDSSAVYSRPTWCSLVSLLENPQEPPSNRLHPRHPTSSSSRTQPGSEGGKLQQSFCTNTRLCQGITFN